MSLSTFFHTVKWFYTQPNDQTILFQTIQFIISIVFCLQTVKCKTVLFQTIQFSIGTQFKCQTDLYDT